VGLASKSIKSIFSYTEQIAHNEISITVQLRIQVFRGDEGGTKSERTCGGTGGKLCGYQQQ